MKRDCGTTCENLDGFRICFEILPSALAGEPTGAKFAYYIK